MQLSANQLYAELKKAFCGAGYDFASADDIAQAGQFMAQQGHDISGDVMAALDAGYPIVQPPSKDGDSWQVPTPATLPDILAGRDFFLSDDSRLLRCDEMCYPVLSFGLMALAQSPYFGSFKTGQGSFVSALCQVHQEAVPASLTLHKTAFVAHSGAAVPVRVAISEACYHLISRYAHKTYVPSSEASRAAGAGAGLTDND